MSVSASLPPFDFRSVLLSLEQLFARALAENTFSGASLLVAKPGLILFHKTWGRTRRRGRPVDSHTLFDLASLTKPLITAPLCMHAVSEGRLSLDSPLEASRPPHNPGRAKEHITIRHLLSHSSGLPAYRPFYRSLILKAPSARQDLLFNEILRTSMLSKPGTVSCYSDLGFMVLLEILERTYEKPFGRLAAEILLEPLRLNSPDPKPAGMPNADDQLAQHGSPPGFLGFRRLTAPRDPTLPPRKSRTSGRVFAATEFCPWRKRLLIGEVHDENAYCLGGIAAHAGLFGTAHGIYSLLMFLWEIYTGRVNHPPWTAETVRSFWTKASLVPGSTWMLGFDTPSPENSSAGSLFSPHSAGHLGFTGTSFWFDLDRQVLVILLTNRVHPTRENERLKSFRPMVHNLVMEAFHDGTRS